MEFQPSVRKWDVFEARMKGPEGRNPYLEVQLDATFRQGSRDIRVPGFYDGNGAFAVRFMPDNEGTWSFKTTSNVPALDGQSGSFSVEAPGTGNHGVVRVANRHHFRYDDGTPYLPFGTTCYAWTHQPLDLQAQTLETLRQGPFNKMRMCVFPKDYLYNENPPLHDIFTPKNDGSFDFDRPNFESFRHLESQVRALGEIGVEADIIIFHPYDRWGYCTMQPEQDYRYVRYLAARLAAFRNVWWSMANEYDFLLDVKPIQQWDRYFHILEENDPYRHLKSIHNGDPEMKYDHRKPWIDHVCIQHWDVKRTTEWRNTFGKPIINDEPEYEGNVPKVWGNISARELVHRYWITLLRGGYAGHGETYMHPEDELWWAKGGVLRGESHTRIGFLHELLKEDVTHGLNPFKSAPGQPWGRVSGARDGHVTYVYFGEHQPLEWAYGLPEEDGDYEIDLIDTWEMTLTPLEKAPLPRTRGQRVTGGAVITGKPEAAFGVKLPGKPNLAIRIRRRR